MYLSAVYDRDMPIELALKVIEVRMWEHGHSFKEIREMNLDDLGTVIGYWHEKGRVEAKYKRINSNGKRAKKKLGKGGR